MQEISAARAERVYGVVFPAVPPDAPPILVPRVKRELGPNLRWWRDLALLTVLLPFGLLVIGIACVPLVLVALFPWQDLVFVPAACVIALPFLGLYSWFANRPRAR